jgi:hypothetical protein
MITNKALLVTTLVVLALARPHTTVAQESNRGKPAPMTFFVTSKPIRDRCRRRRSHVARLSEHSGSTGAARHQCARPHR